MKRERNIDINVPIAFTFVDITRHKNVAQAVSALSQELCACLRFAFQLCLKIPTCGPGFESPGRPSSPGGPVRPGSPYLKRNKTKDIFIIFIINI